MGFVYNILFTFPISYVCRFVFGLNHMVLHLCILYFCYTLYFYTHRVFRYITQYIFSSAFISWYFVLLVTYVPASQSVLSLSFFILHIFPSAYCVCQDIVYLFIVLFFLLTMYFVIFHYNPHI